MARIGPLNQALCRNVRVPRRLWEEMMLALDQAIGRIEALDPDPAVATQQIHEFGQRVLTEARRREKKIR